MDEDDGGAGARTFLGQGEHGRVSAVARSDDDVPDERVGHGGCAGEQGDRPGDGAADSASSRCKKGGAMDAHVGASFRGACRDPATIVLWPQFLYTTANSLGTGVTTECD